MNATLRYAWLRIAGLSLGLCLVFAVAVQAEDELGQRATWVAPTAAQIKTQIDALLAERKVEEPLRGQVNALWPAGTPETDLLDRVANSLAVVDAPVRELVEFCRKPLVLPYSPPKLDWLADDKTPPLVRNNLRLYLARWLAEHRLYDEALETLGPLKVADVVDPAALLFYQAAGFHRLLDKEKCLPLLTQLLQREKEIPKRYAQVARLMQADLAPLKPDTLDEISRLMDEVERRLQHGRAGKKVRDEEADVVAKLDKMIDDLEKKLQQQQQQQSGSGGGGSSPTTPMGDSTQAQLKGKGDVDIKKIGDKAGWGNLPPKDRQEALQQIGKDLPSHYREVIEEYFRKLARDSSE